MNKENDSTWKLLTDYINLKEIDDILTRKEMLQNIRHSSHWTLDSYRLILESVGCLKSEKRGVYKVVMKVPSLPLRIIRDLAYLTLNGNKTEDR